MLLSINVQHTRMTYNGIFQPLRDFEGERDFDGVRDFEGEIALDRDLEGVTALDLLLEGVMALDLLFEGVTALDLLFKGVVDAFGVLVRLPDADFVGVPVFDGLGVVLSSTDGLCFGALLTLTAAEILAL